MLGHASQPITGLLPFNCIRRWPNIETKLGDCPVFALPAILYIDVHEYLEYKPWPNDS